MVPGIDDLPDPEEEAKKRQEAAKEFIEGKGGVQLLCEFPPFAELRFENLVAIAPVSRATVSSRLQEAEKAGIVEVDHVGNKTYKLTKTGQHLKQEAENRRFERLWSKIETLEEELEDEEAEL